MLHCSTSTSANFRIASSAHVDYHVTAHFDDLEAKNTTLAVPVLTGILIELVNYNVVLQFII